MPSIIENAHASLSLRMPRELDELARQAAKRQGMGLSSFVRSSIIKELNRISANEYQPA